MRIVRHASALLLAVGLGSFVACGGPTMGPTTPTAAAAAAHVDGKFKGQPLEAKDAIAYALPGLQGLRILISNEAGTCGKVWQSDYKIRGLRGLQLVVAENRGAPTSPGLFLVNDGSSARFAVGGYVAYDDQCKELEGGVDDTDAGMVAGKLTLDEIDLTPGGHVSGSFDVQFKGGEHLTGTFTALSCAKPAGVEAATFDARCQ